MLQYIIMKIDLNIIDKEQFHVLPKEVNGETLYLVIPKEIGTKWNRDNMIFRSSVWNTEGELISASFPKFFNWGEHPELTPPPKSLKDVNLIEKIDGSTLIVSKYKNNFIIRTRGTTDARQMEKNGWEINHLMEKYPNIQKFQPYFETWPFSIIFEWVSPDNQIVIKYPEPYLKLITLIGHDNYRLWSQDWMGGLAKQFGVQRPDTFNFDTVEEMLKSIEQLKGKEGVVVYFNEDQSLLKVKGIDYLAKHRFKSQATLENTLELYFAMKQPAYQEFEESLIKQFDFECFNMVRGFASQICDVKKEVVNLMQKMKEFVEPLKLLPRKDAALRITSSYSVTGRSGMCFTLLDGKNLPEDSIKKLYWQFLKK